MLIRITTQSFAEAGGRNSFSDLEMLTVVYGEEQMHKRPRPVDRVDSINRGLEKRASEVDGTHIFGVEYHLPPLTIGNHMDRGYCLGTAYGPIAKDDCGLYSKNSDYEQLKLLQQERKEGNVTPRIRAFCDRQFIQTYGDLARRFYVECTGSLHTGEGKERYSKFLMRYRNFGTKSACLFIEHLSQIGFDFSLEHAKRLSTPKTS